MQTGTEKADMLLNQSLNNHVCGGISTKRKKKKKYIYKHNKLR